MLLAHRDCYKPGVAGTAPPHQSCESSFLKPFNTVSTLTEVRPCPNQCHCCSQMYIDGLQWPYTVLMSKGVGSVWPRVVRVRPGCWLEFMPPTCLTPLNLPSSSLQMAAFAFGVRHCGKRSYGSPPNPCCCPPFEATVLRCTPCAGLNEAGPCYIWLLSCVDAIIAVLLHCGNDVCRPSFLLPLPPSSMAGALLPAVMTALLSSGGDPL